MDEFNGLHAHWSVGFSFMLIINTWAHKNTELIFFAFLLFWFCLFSGCKFRLMHPQGRYLVAVGDWCWWWFISSPLPVKQMYHVYDFFSSSFFTPRLIVIAFKLQLKMNVMRGPFSRQFRVVGSAQTHTCINTRMKGHTHMHWQIQINCAMKKSQGYQIAVHSEI